MKTQGPQQGREHQKDENRRKRIGGMIPYGKTIHQVRGRRIHTHFMIRSPFLRLDDQFLATWRLPGSKTSLRSTNRLEAFRHHSLEEEEEIIR